MTEDLNWRCNEILIAWNKGLWRWTRSPMTKGDSPHLFYEIKDNELWEWGF